jgi:hypothetical protein
MLPSYVTVVSGMPRSGTSLMMRMLEAGGIPALTDARRQADRHNPHGYFEDERVSRLAEDSSWIVEARGKAVKVIYRLLPHLPVELEYRVVFMLRDLEEVFDSQQDMLLSRESAAVGQDRKRMVRALSSDLARQRLWLAGQPNMRVLDVHYGGLVHEPESSAERISRFLDGGMDINAMASAVDPKLYRHHRTDLWPPINTDERR